nr:helix-hairpin-helix domain-containing protein [Sphingobacterium composti Ten et al. 2007 non Yoo et al. 2007]
MNYFTFDPNIISESEWEQLGLSSKQIKVIQNYTAKGGKFYKKEDLKKIYSISENDYRRLEPYIKISTKEDKFIDDTESKHEAKPYKHKESSKINLNIADITALKELRGIGSVLANRIIKFRDALGGFHEVSQLREVYGISEDNYELIKHKIVISASQLKKLPINRFSATELSKHPYISKKQAQSIVNYRDHHGSYLDIYTLSQNKALDQDFLRKIEPYLEF